MKNMVKLAVLLLIPLLVLPGCGKKDDGQKDDVRPIKAMRVSGLEAFGGRFFPGQATATQEVNLSFRVPGTLNEFPVDLGDEVKTGDLLARLDPQDLQVEKNNADAQLRKARAGLQLAGSEYGRVRRVWEKDSGAVSKSMVDVRKAELDTARARVASAKAAVEGASDNLRYTNLEAPFDGVVVEKFVQNFEDVQAKQDIVRIVDTSRIEFTVQIPETLIKNASKSIGTIVIFDAFPGLEVPATIKEIGKEASKTTRTYPMTLTMDQPEGVTILPGMAGKARAEKKSAAKLSAETGLVGIEIPITATFSDEAKKSYVWVVNQDSMQVTKREIEVVNLTEKGAMVTGLEPGEMIATAGANLLVEGQQVRILE
jgi:RND family efflux transporter MFP subunit